MFSLSIGIGYTGLFIALLTVCEGSKQMRNLVSFVADAGCSRTTILEIQGVGSVTRTSCPVSISLSRASLIMGILGAEQQCGGAWMGLTSGFKVKESGVPRSPKLYRHA